MQHTGEGDTVKDFEKVWTSLLNPHMAPFSSSDDTATSLCLTALATLSANVFTKAYDSGKDSLSWKRELLELSLYRWLSIYESSADQSLCTSNMVLFHLTFVKCRTNIELIHRFVRWQARTVATENPYLAELREWRDTQDCEVSTHHATQLMSQVKNCIIAKSQLRSGTETPTWVSQRSQQRRMIEAPHIAISVYVVTLVLWTSAITQRKADWKLARSILENSIYVLSCFSVRVATKLGNVLKHLIMTIKS